MVGSRADRNGGHFDSRVAQPIGEPRHHLALLMCHLEQGPATLAMIGVSGVSQQTSETQLWGGGDATCDLLGEGAVWVDSGSMVARIHLEKEIERGPGLRQLAHCLDAVHHHREANLAGQLRWPLGCGPG